MSYRDALKVFKLERTLNDDETAFLNTLRGMTDTERELTVEALSPQSKKSTTKKASKKSSKKSAHASSLQQQIQASKRPPLCSAMITSNGSEEPCQGTENDAIHDKDAGYAGYHEFEPGQVAAASGD